jgi:hypothetical protein
MNKKTKVLAVDDELFNLDILLHHLSKDDYEVVCAEDGVIALQQLEAHPDVEVIVLDRMMPNLNGMQVLEKIKLDERFAHIPVVMQTAAASSEQILQGIQAGVYYYLTKPYENALLLSIVKSALNSVRKKQQIKAALQDQKRVIGLLHQAKFRFRTFDEAKNIACFVSVLFPDAERVFYGLNELLMNAIEHGNLGITYAEKTQLVLSGTWQQEVDRRLLLPENAEKFVELIYSASKDELTVHIKDQGQGFDWRQYLQFSVERVTDPHGRGIATSKMVSFDQMEYQGCGNEVVCTVNLVSQ